jgi:hypothetical protein
LRRLFRRLHDELVKRNNDVLNEFMIQAVPLPKVSVPASGDQLIFVRDGLARLLLSDSNAAKRIALRVLP